jgi:hypothetical protein
VNVSSVEYEPYEDFAAVEDFQDPQQFPELIEASPYCIPIDPTTTCILITLYLFIALH